MSRSIIQARQQQKKKLNAAQKKFNATIRKIEKQKALLAEWITTRNELEKMIATEYKPTLQQYNEGRVELAKRFDQFFIRKSFSNRQREKMVHFMCDTAEELIPKGFDELKAIHDRYSEIDFDTIEEDGKAFAEDMFRQIFEAEFGVDIGDDVDFSNPEEVAKRLADKVQAAEAEQEQIQQESKTKKKPTAAQEKKEAKQKEEEANISQSIKSVYRQLTTALHPDRETDHDERDRKTELMKRVTTAYRNKDLLQLLELQLEVEQIDQHKIDGIAADKLKYFNKILMRQLDEIETEVDGISMALNHVAGTGGFMDASPEDIMTKLELDTEDLKIDVEEIKDDLDSLTTVKSIQQWLSDYELPRDDPFDMFMLPPSFR